MCNCITEIEKKVHEKFPEHNRKKVESVSGSTKYQF